MALLALPSNAWAATITVSTTGDETSTSDNAVSLREAIAAIDAQSDAGHPDVAAARTGAYGTNDTIVLHASGSHYNVSGTELLIQRPLTIQGDGSGATVIDGGNSVRVLHVSLFPAAATSQTITLQNLTVTGGNTGAMPGGGGILVDKVSNTVAVNLSLVGVTVSANTATVSTGTHTCCGGGGGIYSNGGAVALTDTHVNGNTAHVTGDSTSSGTPGACCDGGGGIYDNYGAVTLTRSSVDGNTATVGGPALYCCHGGGGIYAGGGGPVTLAGGSQVSGNSFTLTGSLTDIPGGPSGPHYVGNCCSGGGGIYQDSNADVSVQNSSVNGNTATPTSGNCCHGGGGVFMDGGGNLMLTGATMSGNTATVHGNPDPIGTHGLNHCCSGGGAVATFGGLTLTGSTLDGNTTGVTSGDCCSGGGAVQIDSDRSLTALSSTFSNNMALLTGGSEGGGGGVYEDTGGSARNTYTNSTVSDNTTNATTAQGGGGGLYVLNGSQASPDVLANATVAGNTASAGSGGGIFNDGGKVSAKNSLIALNSAAASADCAGAGGFSFASLGYNLQDAPLSCNFTAPGDKVVPSGSVGLGPLAANGGPTKTRALQSSSAAIDAGNPTGCTDPAGVALSTSQTGSGRPDKGEGACDIGAFEYQDARLTVALLGAGTVSVSVSGSGSGVSCPGACAQNFPQGATVTLTASPAAGSSFAGWSGGCSGKGPCVLLMSSDKSVTATFTHAGARVKLLSAKAKGGAVVVKLGCTGAAGGACQATDTLSTSETVRHGRVVAVSARSKPRARRRVVVGRRSTTIPAGQTRTVTVPLNGLGRKLLKRFRRLPVTLSVSSAGQTVATRRLTVVKRAAKRRRHHH